MGSPDDSTVKFIIAIETKWASSSCSPQPDLKAVISDDFQGTATDGHRYDKVEAISIDPKALARDCQLGDVKVRFFGDSIAIAYGSESRIRKRADGKEARRCQVWTDTWLSAMSSGKSSRLKIRLFRVPNDRLFLLRLLYLGIVAGFFVAMYSRRRQIA